MELSSMGVLLYFLGSCIFSSCIYGHTKSNLASNCIADCISRNRLAIFTNYIYSSSIYMAFKNLMEYYNSVLLCWTGWLGVWRISRNTDCNVGDRRVPPQYDVNARTHSSYVASRSASHGVWSSLCYNTRPNEKTHE